MKKIFLLLCLLTAVYTLNAQSNKLRKPFNKGDQFLVETATNTSSFFQRGDQNLEIGTRIYTAQIFTISAVTEEGYTIIITTTKLVDTVGALGGETRYNSESMNDSLSVVEKAIKNILSATDTILVSKEGMVLSTSKDSIFYFYNKVLPFMGIKPTQFIKGSIIAVFAEFPITSTEKGYQWTHSANSQIAKSMINCTILSAENNNATVAFTAETKGAYANTNTNGVDFIDNLSGTILERRTQNVTLENKILNGVLFSIESRSAVSQHCTLLPEKEN